MNDGRESLIAALERKGFSTTDAHMIADLAAHACKEALATIVRITDTAPGGDKGQLACVVTALMLAKGAIQSTMAEVSAAAIILKAGGAL